MNLLTAIKNRSTYRGELMDKEVEEEKLMSLIEAAQWAPSGHNTQPWEFLILRDKGLIKGVADSTWEVFQEIQADKEKWAEVYGNWPKWLRFSEEEIKGCGDGIYLGHRFKREDFKEIEKSFSSEDSPFSHFIELYCQNIRNSPLLLITLQDRERKAPNLSHELIDLMGVGAALQNIRLAAFSLGIACQDLGLPIDTPSGESRLKKLLGIPGKYRIVSIFRLGYQKESPLMATTRFRRELKDIVHRDRF